MSILIKRSTHSLKFHKRVIREREREREKTIIFEDTLIVVFFILLQLVQLGENVRMHRSPDLLLSSLT